jgi:hypothetical protein
MGESSGAHIFWPMFKHLAGTYSGNGDSIHSSEPRVNKLFLSKLTSTRQATLTYIPHSS